MDEDVATAEALLTAGADVNTLDFSLKKPLDRATDKACCDLYEHHCSASIAFLIAEPTALVNSAMANCASLSVLSEQKPLSLHPYQLEPPFLWAPPAARATVIAWAQEAFIVQLAASFQPFAELPDDCAGVVLEFLGLAMSRKAIHHFATPSLSSEAHAWVRTVLTSAVAVSSPFLQFTTRKSSLQLNTTSFYCYFSLTNL